MKQENIAFISFVNGWVVISGEMSTGYEQQKYMYYSVDEAKRIFSQEYGPVKKWIIEKAYTPNTTTKTKTTELQPIDGRKSFYGKAKVLDHGNKVELQSYSTIVAVYDKKTAKMTVNGWYSTTTARHINAFLSKYGYPQASKKELEKWKTH